MAKYDAVDRLMALATEKRADRTPVAALQVVPADEAAGGPEQKSSSATLSIIPAESGQVTSIRDHGTPEDHGTPDEEPVTGAARARKLFESLRPFLPAVAGAMRLVDHGAVQAVARLLPLLGGGAGMAGLLSPGAGSVEPQPWLPALQELQASHLSASKSLDALTVQLAATEDLLGRTRTQLERVNAAQLTRESELRTLGDKVRLLSAGLIILLMLIIAQMILLVVLLHR